MSHNYKVPNCIEQVVQRILFSYFILGNTCNRGKYMYIVLFSVFQTNIMNADFDKLKKKFVN